MYSDFLDWVSCGIKGSSIKPQGFLLHFKVRINWSNNVMYKALNKETPECLILKRVVSSYSGMKSLKVKEYDS